MLNDPELGEVVEGIFDAVTNTEDELIAAARDNAAYGVVNEEKNNIAVRHGPICEVSTYRGIYIPVFSLVSLRGHNWLTCEFSTLYYPIGPCYGFHDVRAAGAKTPSPTFDLQWPYSFTQSTVRRRAA